MDSRSRYVNCVSPASGETSETAVLLSHSVVNCVSPASGETSETRVPESCSVVNCVRFASGETSETAVDPRANPCRLIACSSPVRAVIPLPTALNSVKSSIASAVITASVGRPRVSRIAAAKLPSGMETSACTGCAVNCARAVNNRVKVKRINFFIWMSPFVYRDRDVPSPIDIKGLRT